jgi:hypothetical protein
MTKPEEILEAWKESEKAMSDWQPPNIPSDRAFKSLISLARESALEEARDIAKANYTIDGVAQKIAWEI